MYSVFGPHYIYVFAWISEQTAIISPYSIDLTVFITEAESVYCTVRTGSSYQTDTVSSLKGESGSSRCVVVTKINQ